MAHLIVLLSACCLLAYSNGANDNFKGVATLFGSKVAGYKKALWWATATTFAGSMASIFLAQTLIRNFSGKGLVPDHIADSQDFVLAIALGAGLTVLLATAKGFPVSTTHGLTGALLGAGLVAAGAGVNFPKLGTIFLLPLLLSPLIAVCVGVSVYLAARGVRTRLGMTKEWCVCVGGTDLFVPMPHPNSTLALRQVTLPSVSVAALESCKEVYRGRILGVRLQKMLDTVHFLSAGCMSFARGLNDTPKIVAALLLFHALGVGSAAIIVAVCMAAGGVFSARKVAATMSEKITPLSPGQGLTANLVTSFLVIFASRLGVPVSTTHVSCGSLFGIGLLTGQANARVVTQIIMAWVLTLPIAGLLSGIIYWLLKTL